MGLHDREYYRDDEPSGIGLGSPKSACITLIIINAAIYFVDVLFVPVQDYMGVRGASLLNPLHWYQLLTAGFAHDRDMMHVLFNMLALFIFGRDVEHAYGKKKFYAFYLTAIVLGNLGFALRTFAYGNPNQPCIGASGAVTAVTILFALKYPRRTILFMFAIPMPAWVLGVIIVVMDLMRSFQVDNIAQDVHLIGAVYGYIFYKTLWDFSSLLPGGRLNFSRLKPKPKVRIYNPESKYEKLDRQADELLEKVHRDGAESLSAKERRILEDYSRRMQQKHR